MKSALVLSGVVAAVAALAWPAAAETPSSCSHVAGADVGKALGTAIASAKGFSSAGTDTCTYRSASMIPYAIVSASRVPAGATPPGEFARVTSMSASLFGAKPVPVHGIGDQAVTITHILWVRRGSGIFSINVVAPGGPAHVISSETAIAGKLHL